MPSHRPRAGTGCRFCRARPRLAHTLVPFGTSKRNQSRRTCPRPRTRTPNRARPVPAPAAPHFWHGCPPRGGVPQPVGECHHRGHLPLHVTHAHAPRGQRGMLWRATLSVVAATATPLQPTGRCDCPRHGAARVPFPEPATAASLSDLHARRLPRGRAWPRPQHPRAPNMAGIPMFEEVTAPPPSGSSGRRPQAEECLMDWHREDL